MKDYASDKSFVKRYRDAALEIARRKMAETARLQAEAGEPPVPMKPRLSTGGHFSGFFLWDTVFGAMWARHAPGGEFPVTGPLDNLLALAEPDGFVARQYDARGVEVWDSRHPVAFAPPLLSWAELTLFREGITGRARLLETWPKLVRHHEACARRFRRPDGLYAGDHFGCGMDDIPRYPRGMSPEEYSRGGVRMTAEILEPGSRGMWDSWLHERGAFLSWNVQAGWVDLTSQMALDAMCLAMIARELRFGEESAAFDAEHAALRAAVNELCWDEAGGWYCDRGPDGVIPRHCAAGFWALLSRTASEERVPRVVAALKDPARFGRPVPFPALSAADPDYDPENGYWLGASWPPTTYAAIRGLVEWGETDFAEESARRWYNANAELWVRTGTVWENVSPEQCERPKNRSGFDFCGWGALAPVAMPAEFGWL
ncbi:MAG: hypothetical protein IJ678_08880 [Kiritimatiellae bacterium]|nr:hypothetical protein [Kiritimatiellia bacterium]MBR1836553.1 hypothetical protein [Kiritimatiellia bacterium]